VLGKGTRGAFITLVNVTATEKKKLIRVRGGSLEGARQNREGGTRRGAIKKRASRGIQENLHLAGTTGHDSADDDKHEKNHNEV